MTQQLLKKKAELVQARNQRWFALILWGLG